MTKYLDEKAHERRAIKLLENRVHISKYKANRTSIRLNK